MDNIEYVVKNSDNVKINKENINTIITDLKKNQYKHWSIKDDIFKSMSEKEIIIFSFILESLNFCFWPNYDWKIIYKGKTYFGSDTLLYTLINAVYQNNIQLKIDELVKMSRDDFNKIMINNNQYPILMEERFESFKETINTIHKNDSFWNEMFSIKNDISLEEYIVNNFKNFKDVSIYKGKTITFNKRCRLLMADLFYVSKKIKDNIGSLSKIRGCADYSLPRYFRELGVLEYSNELIKLIDNGVEIKHNSNYEIEIRATTLYVLEIIKKEMLNKDININSIELDNILWGMSRERKGTNPHHTISIYY